MLKLTSLFITILLFAAAVAAQSSGVKGRVRDTREKGIPNVEVSARQDGKVIRSVKTDSKGNFTLGLDAGKYNIAFDADGYSTGVKYGVEIFANKMRDLGDRLTMTRDRGTLVLIKGVVLDKADLSVEGCAVDLYVLNTDGSTKKIATAVTNDAGEFEFKGIDPVSKVRLKASSKGFSGTKDIEADQPQVYRVVVNIPLDHPKEK